MSVAANRYAKALLDALYPERAEAGGDQLQRFGQLLQEHPDAKRMFENPTFSATVRHKLLTQLSEKLGFDQRVTNFINILIERNRLLLLDEIIAAYQRFLDDRLGIVHAVVTSARPLDASQRSDLSARLEKATSKKVRMEVLVDESLIGGVVAQVGSTVFDGSVRQQLQSFKNRLVQE